MDREKVISWLEGLADDDWRECYSDSEVQETARQALDLIDELLKEKEAVKPKINEYGKAFCECGENVGIIPNSKHLRSVRMKFCPECGKVVKWK